MNRTILHALMAEYVLQLEQALTAAQCHLEEAGQVPIALRRAWKPADFMENFANGFRTPNEDTPAELWYWAETTDRHPALDDLQQVIGRIADFVERLAVEAVADE